MVSPPNREPELWQVQSVSPSDQLMKQMTDVQLVGDPRKPNVQGNDKSALRA